jgi:multicomponent Na+:H+ antiporter subunit D
VTELLAAAPMLVALVSATVTLGVRRWHRLQRALSVVGAVAYVAVVGALAWRVVVDGEALVYQFGGWEAPNGITFVADALTAFMLAITATVALYAVVFSVRFVDRPNQRVYYHPLYHFLLLGATGALLAGDLFNLFVWFEVMLMASYVFVVFYGAEKHTAAAMRYVVLNIVGGVLMLVGIGGLYAVTGTLNMARMAEVLASPELAPTDTAPVVGLAGLLLVTFALKAGLVPFQFWVPSAYRAAPIPIAALFAGATKKVGIYAIIRLYFTVFGDAAVTAQVPAVATESAPLAVLAPVLLVMGAASVLLGGVGAVGQDELDGLFAYSSIGQVGFIAVPLALAAATTSPTLRHLGVLAGLVYALHHALTKGLLFLLTGVVRDGMGTTRLSDLGGIGQRSPAFAGVFFVGTLSLVGIPPLTGFFGKLFAFDAAARAFDSSPTAGSALVVGVLLVGAFLTIVYTTRAWLGVIWGAESAAVTDGRIDQMEVAVLVTLAALVVAVGVGFEPVYQFADAAADAALDSDEYIDLVVGETE